MGVILRVLVLVNVLAVLTAAIPAADFLQWWSGISAMAVWIQFPLILSLLMLYGLKATLDRLAARTGWLAVLAISSAVTALWLWLLGQIFTGSLLRGLAWVAVAWAATLAYFQYQAAKHSPAISEARLLALTARIRPHFFFNSLNGVLGMIRSDPRRAEIALEELADLFRVLMRDNRDLVPLADELQLCQRYLGLEQLRLGERLQIRWEDADCPKDALVPPLMLQPLLENAVYHGIEPFSQGGVVEVQLGRKGGELQIDVSNPLCRQSGEAAHSNHGNRLALANLRERLMLFFDLEASMTITESDSRFTVRIRLPVRKAG